MFERFMKKFRKETIDETVAKAKQEIVSSAKKVKKVVEEKTDQMVAGKNGKRLIFVSVAVSLVSLAIVAIKSANKAPVVVNVYNQYGGEVA